MLCYKLYPGKTPLGCSSNTYYTTSLHLTIGCGVVPLTSCDLWLSGCSGHPEREKKVDQPRWQLAHSMRGGTTYVCSSRLVEEPVPREEGGVQLVHHDGLLVDRHMPQAVTEVLHYDGHLTVDEYVSGGPLDQPRLGTRGAMLFDLLEVLRSLPLSERVSLVDEVSSQFNLTFRALITLILSWRFFLRS